MAAEATADYPRLAEARQSFLSSIEVERCATQLGVCDLTDQLGRIAWRTQIDAAALLAMTAAHCLDLRKAPPQPPTAAEVIDSDQLRRRLRDYLVQIAGAAWRAARDLGVEDEIPF